MQVVLEGLMEDYLELGDFYFICIFWANDLCMVFDGLVFYVKGFLQYELVCNFYDFVQVYYLDLLDIEEELEQVFWFFQYYFFDELVFIVFILILEYVVVVFVYGENDLGVFLDYFFGEDYFY